MHLSTCFEICPCTVGSKFTNAERTFAYISRSSRTHWFIPSVLDAIIYGRRNDESASVHWMVWLNEYGSIFNAGTSVLIDVIHFWKGVYTKRKEHAPKTLQNTPIQIYRKFHLQKLKIFRWKTLTFSIFLLKKYIVGTHNLCFWAEIRKILLHKSGV